jgi:alpha-galactosidase
MHTRAARASRAGRNAVIFAVMLGLVFLPAARADLLHSCSTEDALHQDAGLPAGGELPPFSFLLGPEDSASVLARSRSSTTATPIDAERTQIVTLFYDAITSLQVNVSQVLYTGLVESSDVTAREWVVTYSNNGTAATPPLCAVYAVNMTFPDAAGSLGVTEVRRYAGSSDVATDFADINSTLSTGSAETNYTWFFPNGGRSSDGVLPFFTAFNSGLGFTISIGWSGSWAAALRRGDANGQGDDTHIWVRHDTMNGDCPGICTPLLPGEAFSTMRILLVAFPAATADSYHLGVNAHRRLLVRYKVPRSGNSALVGAVSSALSWLSLPNCPNLTFASQLGFVQAIKDSAAVEAYWLDASYFNGCFPDGVGNWQLPLSAVIDQNELPGSDLASLGAAAHASPNPVKFILWVEPERVARGTYIATHHTEFLLQGSLLNLGNATARAYMTVFLTDVVAELNLDVLRLDFNIDPGRIWRASDAPGRDGMTQLLYNAGLYAMWDAVLASRPGLVIDNCASGGRRIDLETLSRSVPLWRSDFNLLGTHPESFQMQTMGLSAFSPVHAGTVDELTPYVWRSGGSMAHTIVGPLPSANDTAGLENLRAAQAEVLRLRALTVAGDYYPLTPNTLDASFAAWQHHCDGAPACGGAVGGALHVFRRGNATEGARVLLPVFAIAPAATYEVRESYTFALNRTRTLLGTELSPFAALLPQPSTSLLVEYACTAGC